MISPGHVLHVLFVLFCRCHFIVTVPAPECLNCGCCVDRVCEDTFDPNFGWREDVCTHGCNPGYGGLKCKYTCPDDCVTCEHTTKNNCETCENGKYLTSVTRSNDPYLGCVDCRSTCTICTSETSCQECTDGHYNIGQYNNCSEECPINCKTCTSSTNCQECYTPFYNEGSTTDCSLSCPGNCVCSSPGMCSSCKDGYFNENEQCLGVCPSTCKTCSDQRLCQSCKDGYYNAKEMSTNNEITDCSLSCRGTCFQCTSYDECTTCKQRHYGSYCQHNCSLRCTNGACDTDNGTCDCIYGFKGNLCDECAIGRYGQQCDKQCPTMCKDNVCTRDAGNCLECKSTNITGVKCDLCILDTWGTMCSYACPTNFQGHCVRNIGYCASCEGNFQGNTCYQCLAGYYGELCDEECPEQCYSSLCYRYNGTCGSCNKKYAGSTCDDCVVGFYGDTCDAPCLSTKCANNIYNRETGACISCQNGLYGLECEDHCSRGCNVNVCDFGSGACECKGLYTGDKCCVNGGHCRDCSSNTDCETCENGFFGTNCSLPCPNTCATDGQNSQCEKTNGNCLKCLVGFYGDQCKNTCNDKCANNRCAKDDGHCTDGCTGHFEGPTCAQVDGTAGIVGIAVGVSAATIVVVIFILLAIFCFILRRRKRTNEQGKMVEASYVNTEFQASETPDQQEDTQTPHEYEVLGARIQMDETEYDEIKYQQNR